MRETKVHVKLGSEDQNTKFFQMTNDATRKFYEVSEAGPAGAETDFLNVKAVGITRAITVIGEGTLEYPDLAFHIPKENRDTDEFENRGFIKVDKIEED